MSFFVHLFMDDCHLGYINNFLKKRQWFQSMFFLKNFYHKISCLCDFFFQKLEKNTKIL
jgi:hypothetical protein